MNLKLTAFFTLLLVAGLMIQTSAQPGYAGEWKKTRLYGHSFNPTDFTDEEYDWIRDHFEYFTIEKTHRRTVYGDPSHEITSRETATKLIEANPRCKPLMIYSIGSAYPHLFESEAEILVTNPEYFIYDENGDPDDMNLENQSENDWYVETTNWNVENSDLQGIFLDGYKGAYTAHTEPVQYISDRMTGFRLVNGMDFAPDGLTIRGWPECINYSDGIFIDAFFRRRVMSPDAGVVLLDACMDIPEDQMFVCFSAYDGYSSTYEFSHAAYLIVAHENTYYRWVDEGHLWNSTSLMTWHDDFGKEMGAPLGKAVKDGYVYTRVFEHCAVTIDVENITSHIEWGQNNGIPVTGVNLSPSSTSLEVGETQQLSSIVSPLDASDQDVSYSSSNTSVASVSSSGLISAVGAGFATITVTTNDGSHTDECSVTVTVPTGSNLALNGTASQSSVGWSGLASRAIDDDTNGAWSGGSVTHTAGGEANPWWEVDLGGEYSIGDVNIFGRTDACCASRLSEYTLSVIDANGETTYTEDFTDYPEVSTHAGDVMGQVIRVQLNTTNTALSLAEVQVFEGEDSSIPTVNTIAIQENETGFCSVDGNINNNNAGFTGDGFANTSNAQGNGVNWEIDGAAGSYTFTWRYATTTSRPGDLLVNGLTVAGNVTFAPSGGWSSWTNTGSTTVTLDAGVKAVRLEATSASGLGNIDYMEVIGPDAAVSDCQSSARLTGKVLNETNYSVFNIYPNPVEGQMNIELEYEERAQYHVLNTAGQIMRSGHISNGATTVDLSAFKTGFYLIRVSGESTSHVQKVFKK